MQEKNLGVSLHETGRHTLGNLLKNQDIQTFGNTY